MSMIHTLTRVNRRYRLNEYTAASPILFTQDNSSLTGWTTVNTSITNVQGNPPPSFTVAGSGRCYINAGIVPNSTVSFDAKVISSGVSLSDFFFLCSSSGAGQIWRLECRNTYSGFAAATTWTSYSGPSSGITTLAANTWYNIKIQIASNLVASVFINGVLQGNTYNCTNGGTYFGCNGVVTGTYFQNLRVYAGLV